MDLQGEDDDMSEYSQPDSYSGEYDFEDGGFEDYGPDFAVGIVRVPLNLLDSLAAAARTIASGPTYFDGCSCLSATWMKAIALKYPDTPLSKLRASDPSLMPRWLLERCSYDQDQDLVVLRPGGIVARRDNAEYINMPGPNPESILAATLRCRFRQGFALEGMLCNKPPIPLRVLDFLEQAEDLLNLALVCKATHRAGHVLLQREFHDDVYFNDIPSARRQRKKSMLESAMRHPLPKTTASTSTPAPNTGTETRTGADTAEQDHLCESLAVEAGQNRLYHVMLILLWAEKSPEQNPIMPPPLVNKVDPMLPKGMLARDQYLHIFERSPIVMDGEAVKRAAAMLEYDLGPPDALDWAQCRAREVVRIVHAAKREGQGLILHRGFSTDPD